MSVREVVVVWLPSEVSPGMEAQALVVCRRGDGGGRRDKEGKTASGVGATDENH